ncbi:MAG: putative quinol monooxygenase [Reyranellaceae bacterium]
MILITGSILARPETLEEIKRLGLEHVRRSRQEDGCLHHSIQVDVENPLRLVFVERWRDKQAVMKHFADKDARNFVRTARALAAAPTEIGLYESREIPFDSLT